MALLGLIAVCGCTENQPVSKTGKAVIALPQKEIEMPIDTSASFRIGSYWVTPDSLFDFNTLIKSGEDTLHIVACQKYIIEPFGPTENEAQLQKSLLKYFSATTRYTKQDNGIFPFVSLAKGNNKLLVYFSNDPEELVYSNILKGEIKDSSVIFANGIRIGMQANDFYKKFFKEFPLALQRKYKTVVFDYCVDNIRHIYQFNDGKLVVAKFSQPGGIWKLDY